MPDGDLAELYGEQTRARSEPLVTRTLVRVDAAVAMEGGADSARPR